MRFSFDRFASSTAQGFLPDLTFHYDRVTVEEMLFSPRNRIVKNLPIVTGGIRHRLALLQCGQGFPFLIAHLPIPESPQFGGRELALLTRTFDRRQIGSKLTQVRGG